MCHPGLRTLTNSVRQTVKLVTDITLALHYRVTLASDINIQKMSPTSKFSHQHRMLNIHKSKPSLSHQYHWQFVTPGSLVHNVHTMNFISLSLKLSNDVTVWLKPVWLVVAVILVTHFVGCDLSAFSRSVRFCGVEQISNASKSVWKQNFYRVSFINDCFGGL